jgi:hypothetical protein
MNILWWGGRPWPPTILAGTEARPTEVKYWVPKQELGKQD